MKKFLLFIVICLFSVNLHSQNKKLWFDFQLAEHFGLNDWINNKSINNVLYKPLFTEFRTTFNWNFYRLLGIYADGSLALYIYPSNTHFDINSYPVIDLDYYQKDSWSLNEQQPISLMMSWGVFYKIDCGKWNILPRLGIGIQDMNNPQYTYNIKEKDTNAVYSVDYNWFSQEENYVTLGYLASRINFAYKIGKESRLLFGIEYRRFLKRVQFSAQVTDDYNDIVIGKYSEKGNYMNTLGISLGISF